MKYFVLFKIDKKMFMCDAEDFYSVYGWKSILEITGFKSLEDAKRKLEKDNIFGYKNATYTIIDYKKEKTKVNKKGK